jgi:shikimate dehydrogenase
MHNAAFSEMGLDLCYIALPVRPDSLIEAVEGLRAMGFVGFNLTVPHKEAVMPVLNKLSPEASFIGAVNTVVSDHLGRLTGHNTDGRGYIHSLEEADVDVEGKRVLILGSGGAARAVSWYLCLSKAEVFIHARNPETSTRLVNDLLINYKNVSALESLDGEDSIESMDIIINATPLGLKETDPMPLDTAKLHSSQVASDLIYANTPFLKEAAGKGLKTVNGLGMLLWQGVLASELWTGQRPPVETMRKVLVPFLK